MRFAIGAAIFESWPMVRWLGRDGGGIIPVVEPSALGQFLRWWSSTDRTITVRFQATTDTVEVVSGGVTYTLTPNTSGHYALDVDLPFVRVPW